MIFLNKNGIRESGIRQSLSINKKAKLDDLNSKVEPLLARTTNVLTNYTEHTLKHSLGVESVYDLILDNNYDLLNENEKFYLIAATLLHDIGMVGSKDELSNLGYEDFRRKGHHSFSKEIIKEHAGTLGFDRVEANIISDIAEAHRKVDLNSLHEQVSLDIGGSIRMRLLGSLIRFADELHITKDRSSELLIGVLSPDKSSLKHHNRHLSVIGVNRNHLNKNNIEISAIIEDWESEKLMKEMHDEISKKLDEVREIFSLNDIHIDKVQMQYMDEVLVTKEVYLELSNSDLDNFDLFETMPERKRESIAKVLSKLTETSLIFKNDKNKYALNSDERTFKTIFNNLVGTHAIYDFINSDYVARNIGNIFDKIALDVYSHRVFNGDREDRLLLIKSSPTVMDQLLNNQEMDITLGQLNRSMILDLLILNGYMQDVAINPFLSKNEESIFAMQSIENDIHKNLGGFLKLIQHMDKKTLDTSQEQLVASMEKNQEDKKKLKN